MGAPQATTGLVYDDLASFPDDRLRRELIAGHLVVTPAPSSRHQEIVAWLTTEFMIHARQHGGWVYPAPLDVVFADDTVLEPDVLFIGEEHLDRIGERFIEGPPDLVIEVSSPSTRRLELVRKREVYERFGVPEYWYVDIDAERVEVHRLEDDRYPSPMLLHPGDTLITRLLPGLELPVAALIHPRG